jgi:16S rRNA (guanine1207-N2)-methyltransferase
MGGHYFDQRPDAEDRRREIKVRLAGRDLNLMTSSGTFSPDHLDKATEVLMNEAPLPTSPGTYLDLGCGWGPIALSLVLSAPGSMVWAVDVNERARELTALNAKRHRLELRVAAPTGVPGEVEFDEIWSNPPVRIGKDSLHLLLATWMPRLKRGGRAYLVIGKNLGSDPLQRWLTDSGWPTERIASSRGFRVLRVTRT